MSALEDWERLWQLSVSPNKCCVLSVGKKVLGDSSLQLSIDGSILPVVNSCVDLGITVSNDLSPRLHINNMVAKAHKRANVIHRCFISTDVNALVRAFIVYVRPIVEYNTPCPKIGDTPSFKRAQFSLKFMDFNGISYTALS